MTGKESGIEGRKPIQLLRARFVQIAEHAAAVLHQDLGAVVIRRCLEAAELHRAGEAQAHFERRHREGMIAGIKRQARHLLRVGERHVIAALGVERDLVAEHGGELLRPGAGRDHDAVAGDAAGLGLHRAGAFRTEVEAGDALLHDAAAVLREEGGDLAHQAEIVEDVGFSG